MQFILACRHSGVPPRVISILTLLSQQKECAVLTRMKCYAVYISPTPKERYSSDSLGVRMIKVKRFTQYMIPLDQIDTAGSRVIPFPERCLGNLQLLEETFHWLFRRPGSIQ